MTNPITPPATIRAITQARLSRNAPRGAVGTATSLAFALDHARAREAVHSELDVPRLTRDLAQAGIEHAIVISAAQHRDVFVTRPDLGRQLPEDQASTLTGFGEVDVALVLGDGLSAVAVALNGAAFMTELNTRLTQLNLRCSPVILARQARVALGDGIACAMGAQTVVMVLGERPGLSAADGLGVYITQNPTDHTADSARHCLSNVREEGLPVTEAVAQTCELIKQMRATGLSGVALNQRLAIDALPEN